MRLKILIAVVVPPHMSVSGAVRAAEQLAAALAAQGEVSVTVASMLGTPRDMKTTAVRHAVEVRLPAGLLMSSRLPNRVRTLFYRSDIDRIVRNGGWDLVHIHNPTPGLEMRRIARACRSAGVPYAISTHGFNEVANGHAVYGFGAAKRILWNQLAYRPVADAVTGASAILALSPADHAIVRAMGFRGSNLFTVPNGVHIPPPPDPVSDARLLRRFGISAEREPGRIACMFLANHTPNKGLPVLLQAFAALRQPYLLIIGGERRADVDYDAIPSADPDRRIVVTGRLSDAEVSALMRRSDLFVFPTLADTLPLVVFEAMAHGLPVLASAVGGIPYQIDGDCGALVPPNDPMALAAEINQLASDPTRLRAMGLNARLRAATLAAWPAVARQTADIYRRIVVGSHRTPAPVVSTEPVVIHAANRSNA